MSGGHVSPFRLSPDDLPDLDNRTRNGLLPLLDALNITLQQLVQQAQVIPDSDTRSFPFTTDATGMATIDITPRISTRAMSVVVNQLFLEDETPITFPYSMTWIHITAGVQLLIVGLGVSTKYQLRVTIT